MMSGNFAAPWKLRRQVISCLLAASLPFPALSFARADTIAVEKVVTPTPQVYGEKVRAKARKIDSLYAQYVAPGLGGVSGGYGAGGGIGGYGAGGTVVTIVAVGLLSVLASGSGQTSSGRADNMTSASAPMSPNRKINEQDCTKPIVFDGGNLLCK